MSLARKLIVEHPTYDIEYVMEQKNSDSEKRMYVTGSYLMGNELNKNHRYYPTANLIEAVNHFNGLIKDSRAGGTLNHESSPDIDLGKLCHKIVSLEQDKRNPNVFIGKSMVLSTPSGRIYESLIKDGMRIGMSSRSLGRVVEENTNKSKVEDLVLISIDAVYEPSIGGMGGDPNMGFVNGILENKSFIIADDGKIAEAYERLEKSIAKYPSRHRDAINQHILESLNKFLANIK